MPFRAVPLFPLPSPHPQPVAEVAPKLLKRHSGSRLLLADPPDRARHNRCVCTACWLAPALLLP